MTNKSSFIGVETLTDLSDTPFVSFERAQWALYLIERYGGSDSNSTKSWLIDCIVRLQYNAPVTVKVARWSDGSFEYRPEVGTCPEYEAWVEQRRRDGYGWEDGG